MKVDKAREIIEELQEYVSTYENYQPNNLKEKAIKLYAEHENISKITGIINEKGYRKEGKLVAGKRRQVKYMSNDITEMIDSDVDPDDELHDIVKKALNRNRRRKGIVT